MTHLLEINNNSGSLLFDLLQEEVHADLASRQIVPISNGRWEERYRMFAKSADTAEVVRTSVYDLDVIVRRINQYGAHPAFNVPIWLNEKSEGESSENRHAALFSAAFQPTVEGSVGQLLIGNGFVGILTIERGDWEAKTLTTSALASGQGGDSLFGDVIISNDGSLNGRFNSLSYISDLVDTEFFVMGIREELHGTANYQPCFSLGSGVTLGTSGTGFALVDDTSYTEPNGQSNTNTACKFLPNTATHTHLIELNEVSESVLDSINEDYIGSYNAYLRWTSANLFGHFIKLTLSYGYENAMISNNPVYIDTTSSGNFINPLNLGLLDIPTFAYSSGDLGVSALSEFTVGLTVESIGDKVGAIEFIADSLFIIPSNSVSMRTPINGTDTAKLQTFPDDSYFIRGKSGAIDSEITMNMSVPVDGVIGYYNENKFLGGNVFLTAFSVSFNYYEKFNSLGV